MLTTLKHAGQCEFLGHLFGIKGPTFERLINKVISMLRGPLYESLVARNSTVYPMEKMLEEQCNFKHFRFARCAIDVTFQQAYRPNGSMQEGKVYFSGKHKLYGFQMEASVLPNSGPKLFSALPWISIQPGHFPKESNISPACSL